MSNRQTVRLFTRARLILLSVSFLQVISACHRGFDNTATINSQDASGGKSRSKDSLLDLLYGKGSMTKGPTTIEDDPTFVGIPMEEFIADSEDLPIENDYRNPDESDQAVSIPDADDQWRKSFRKELAENQDADLRQYDSPVKNQGSTSLCTSFATVAAIENKAKQKSGIDLDLSERHMFSLYGSYSTPKAARASQRSFIAPEAAWPFRQSSGPDSMEGRGIAKTAVLSNQLRTTSQMVAELQAGNPIIIGVGIRKPMLLRGAILNKQGSEASIGHAMMAVGVFFDSKFSNEGGGVLILKNSYGTQRGDGGYVYMPLDFCGSGRRCYAWAVRDVELRNVQAPEPEDLPNETAPGFVGPPQSNNEVAQVNPADLALRVHYAGWTGSQKRFMLSLDGPQAELGAVASVTFKIHPSFGSNAAEVVSAGTGHFMTSVYRTAYRNWRTQGATVTTVSGERFDLPGVLIDF